MSRQRLVCPHDPKVEGSNPAWLPSEEGQRPFPGDRDGPLTFWKGRDGNRTRTRCRKRDPRPWGAPVPTGVDEIESQPLAEELLVGELGSIEDPPARISTTGELLAVDGTDLSGLETDDIDTFEDGPEVVLAMVRPAQEYCRSLGSTAEIQTTWQGGVAGPQNSEPGADQLAGFTVADGGSRRGRWGRCRRLRCGGCLLVEPLQRVVPPAVTVSTMALVRPEVASFT